jgi:hypothetical protein
VNFKGDAMSDFDREALKLSLQQHAKSAPFRNRVAAQRGAQQELAAAIGQIRQETIQTLEGELKQAGIEVRKLHVALARNRKRTLDAITALRPPRAAPSPPRESAAAAPTSGRFRSLQALAGRAIPLAQPASLTFLNAPLFFLQYGTAIVESFSIAPNNTFVQVVISGYPDALEVFPGGCVFCYVWNNESDSAMLTTVSTAIELTGVLSAVATAEAPNCLASAVRSRLRGSLSLGSTDDPLMESRVSIFGDVRAQSRLLWDEDVGEQWFYNQDHGLSLDSFLVPPNSTLVVTVWVDLWVVFNFNVGSTGNWGNADFYSIGGRPDPNQRISVPGVVVIASPVQTIQAT